MPKKEFTLKKRGKTSRRRLSAVMGVASTLLLIALIMFFSVGMVGAALGVGIGGFVANFDKVNATDGAEIFPVLGQQPACENAPQLQASINGTAKLSGSVEFFKDLPLPDSGFDNDDFARIMIVGQDNGTPIQVSDLDLRLSSLETETLGLRGADIREYSPDDYSDEGGPGAEGSFIDTTDDRTGGIDTEGPSVAFDDGRDALDPSTGNSSTPEFGIDAPDGFLIENGSAAAHFVSFGGISLSDLNLAVQILNETDTDDRVLSTGERNCESLANQSIASEAINLSG